MTEAHNKYERELPQEVSDVEPSLEQALEPFTGVIKDIVRERPLLSLLAAATIGYFFAAALS